MPAGTVPVTFTRGIVTTVHQGDCLVSAKPESTLSTVLGSCIAACVRDRAANVGGMNHFLLASRTHPTDDRFGQSARYGAFAMEQLINMVLAQGTGRKSDLEFKVFGGGNIHAGMIDVGAKNIEFVRDFLQAEGYPISGEDLGGNFARRLMYQPASGRAFVKRLDSTDGVRLVREELAIARLQVKKTDIELF